jgi:hypothetical protein
MFPNVQSPKEFTHKSRGNAATDRKNSRRRTPVKNQYERPHDGRCKLQDQMLSTFERLEQMDANVVTHVLKFDL